MRCPPCLWRAVTDDLVKSRSEPAAVRLTTQCVPCSAQRRFWKGSGTFRRPCARVRVEMRPRRQARAQACPWHAVPGHLRIALDPCARQACPYQRRGWIAPENCPAPLRHCKTQSYTAVGRRRANGCQKSIEKPLKKHWWARRPGGHAAPRIEKALKIIEKALKSIEKAVKSIEKH